MWLSEFAAAPLLFCSARSQFLLSTFTMHPECQTALARRSLKLRRSTFLNGLNDASCPCAFRVESESAGGAADKNQRSVTGTHVLYNVRNFCSATKKIPSCCIQYINTSFACSKRAEKRRQAIESTFPHNAVGSRVLHVRASASLCLTATSDPSTLPTPQRPIARPSRHSRHFQTVIRKKKEIQVQWSAQGATLTTVVCSALYQFIIATRGRKKKTSSKVPCEAAVTFFLTNPGLRTQ